MESLQQYRKELEALAGTIGTASASVEQALRIASVVRFEIEHGVPEAERLAARLAQPSRRFSGRTALISDIHGSFAGLSAVLEDIAAQRCDRILCLGDLVEGGPENERVIDTLRSLGIACVRGNHDEINDVPLAPPYREFLLGLPERIDEAGVLYTHISPRERRRKIDHAVEAWNVFDEHAFRLLFIGHVHVPMLFGQHSTSYGEAARHAFDYNQPFTLAPDDRYIVSVGAVAYGRDQVGRIRYAIHDSLAGTVEFRAIDGPLLPLDYTLRSLAGA